MIAVRCYTCGRVTGNKWDRYVNLLRSGKSIQEALYDPDMKLINPMTRKVEMCCARMFKCNINLMPKMLDKAEKEKDIQEMSSSTITFKTKSKTKPKIKPNK